MALSWFDLEAKFKELTEELAETRVDAHWGGSVGEHWRLAGSFERTARQRFESTARMAGEKLLAQLGNHPDIPAELSAESDPVVRWYKAIWKLAGGLQQDFIARERDKSGKPAGHVTGGTIRNVAKASSTLCLMINSKYGDRPSGPPARQVRNWCRAVAIPFLIDHRDLIIVGLLVTIVGTVIGGVLLAVIL